MNINYPAEYEIGDIVFTCIGAALFGQISAASNCWSNHVGIIIGHNGEDFLVAESRVPLSTITTLSRFIKRSSNQRYAIKRLDAGLTERQKQRIVEQVPSRLRKLYHTGFKYESSRQFCSKFVFDIYKEALCIPVGEIETFGELLNSNPNAKLTFWKFWFLGSIPWERKTVTPASLWHHPGLVLIHAEGVETPQPERPRRYNLTQSPSRQVQPRFAHLHRILTNVAVGDSNRQRIGGIRLWISGQFQQGADHMLHLAFSALPIPTTVCFT